MCKFCADLFFIQIFTNLLTPVFPTIPRNSYRVFTKHCQSQKNQTYQSSKIIYYNEPQQISAKSLMTQPSHNCLLPGFSGQRKYPQSTPDPLSLRAERTRPILNKTLNSQEKVPTNPEVSHCAKRLDEILQVNAFKVA